MGGISVGDERGIGGVGEGAEGWREVCQRSSDGREGKGQSEGHPEGLVGHEADGCQLSLPLVLVPCMFMRVSFLPILDSFNSFNPWTR
jgi:hypothetical protein